MVRGTIDTPSIVIGDYNGSSYLNLKRGRTLISKSAISKSIILLFKL